MVEKHFSVLNTRLKKPKINIFNYISRIANSYSLLLCENNNNVISDFRHFLV